MSLRARVIRLAYLNPAFRRYALSIILAADEGEDDAASSSGSGRPSGKFIQFMEEEGDKRVRNPDTGNEVKIKSLRGPKGKKLVQDMFRRWLDAQKDQDEPAKPKREPESESEESEPESSGFPTPTLKKNRYKGRMNVTLYIALGKPKGTLRKGGPQTVKAIEAMSKVEKVTEESLADMIGCPVLMSGDAGDPYTMVVSNAEDGLNVSVRGPHVKKMMRRLKLDEDGPYIYNDTLELEDNAPKGLGTKIFASQVAQAKKMGAKSIRCSAFRDRSQSHWVGYKVWPKLGYDGPIPFEGSKDSSDKVPPLPKELEDKIRKAGFEEPYMVSHLYRVEGGEEWWEENGTSFDAKFDLADDSFSMKVLSAYLERKAKQDGKSPEEWMTRMAAKKKKDEEPSKGKPKGKGRENIDLDDDDKKVLDDVWRRLRE